jgi:hypothetical protein
MAEIFDEIIAAALFMMAAYALACVLGFFCGPLVWHRNEPYWRQLGRDLRYLCWGKR